MRSVNKRLNQWHHFNVSALYRLGWVAENLTPGVTANVGCYHGDLTGVNVWSGVRRYAERYVLCNLLLDFETRFDAHNSAVMICSCSGNGEGNFSIWVNTTNTNCLKCKYPYRKGSVNFLHLFLTMGKWKPVKHEGRIPTGESQLASHAWKRRVRTLQWNHYYIYIRYISEVFSPWTTILRVHVLHHCGYMSYTIGHNGLILIIIKNNIIIITRTFPECFAPENFSMLNNLVKLWSKRTLYHVAFTPTWKLSVISMLRWWRHQSGHCGNKRCFSSLQERASINSKADNVPWWSLEWAIWKLAVYIWHLKVKVALYRSISQGTGKESVAIAV